MLTRDNFIGKTSAKILKLPVIYQRCWRCSCRVSGVRCTNGFGRWRRHSAR